MVNGAKTFITSGVRADFVTTAVRTGGPGYGGVSLLVIDKNSPGFEVSRRLDKMGWRCSDTAELSFVDVRVPADNLVGAENSGFLQIMQQFQAERLGIAVQAYATAGRALDLAKSWARERETFGRPLTGRQIIRHKLAEMARQVDVACTYTRAVMQRWLAGRMSLPRCRWPRTPLCMRATTWSMRRFRSSVGWATCVSLRSRDTIEIAEFSE